VGVGSENATTDLSIIGVGNEARSLEKNRAGLIIITIPANGMIYMTTAVI
jgi:hypothetical protein